MSGVRRTSSAVAIPTNLKSSGVFTCVLVYHSLTEIVKSVIRS